MKYVQEQIEQARGRDFMEVDESDDSSDEEDEVSGSCPYANECSAVCTDTTVQGEFYTEGTDDLLAARRKLAGYSLSK